MEKFPPMLVPDTNYLMDYPDLLEEPWQISGLVIVICETVEEELKGLARAPENPGQVKQANRALAKIAEFRSRFAVLKEEETGVQIKFSPRFTQPLPPLDMNIKDHQIIGLAYKLAQMPGVTFCAILSNDKELCDIAETLPVLTISRYNEERFHQEVGRKWEWSVLKSEAGLSSFRVPTEKRKKKPVRRLTAGSPLDHYAAKLYRQMKALSFRTTLFLPSLQARIRLAIEFACREDHKKETLMILVKNQADEQYWMGEVLEKGGVPPKEVALFGSCSAEQIQKARIVFYQHRQIITQVPQFVTRLRQAKKKVLAVVDGSDLLDPVELAILLYECDKFVGLSHLPWNNSESRGRKILNVVMHNHALSDVSFAEAEREGWGHPCDLYLSPVEFMPDERQYWDETNAEFLRLREKIRLEFEQKGGVHDFWEEVMERLARDIHTDSADLIKLREQREQMAQQAFRKMAHLLEFFPGTPQGHRRLLIMDFNHLWTPALLKMLEKSQYKPVELPADPDAQRRVWEGFAAHKYDTLILTRQPALDLPIAPYQHLIFMTPLQPMDEMIALIDWALMHTAEKGTLSTHVLYVPGTPEEIAAVALGEAAFQ